MFDEAHEIVGWFGMLLILFAYSGVSMQWFAPETILYQGLNIAGAGALLYSAYKTKSYPVVALNIAWLVIAALSIYKF